MIASRSKNSVFYSNKSNQESSWLRQNVLFPDNDSTTSNEGDFSLVSILNLSCNFLQHQFLYFNFAWEADKLKERLKLVSSNNKSLRAPAMKMKLKLSIQKITPAKQTT